MILRATFFFFLSCNITFFFTPFSFTPSFWFIFFFSIVDCFFYRCQGLAHWDPALCWSNASKIEENLIRVTINKWLKNPPFTIIRKVLHRFDQTFYCEWDESLPHFRTFHSSFSTFQRHWFVLPFFHSFSTQ